MSEENYLYDFPKDSPKAILGKNSLIRKGTIIYRGVKIGDGFQAGHNALIREKCKIGNNVSVGSGSIIEHSVLIGDQVRLHSGCFIPEHTVIESGAWLGPCVTITNSKFPNRPDSKLLLQGVKICTGAIIGANVTLLPGVVIGANSLVGAGSVVTKNIPPNVIAFGNPAKVKRSV